MKSNKLIETLDILTIQSKNVRTHTLSDGKKVTEPFSFIPIVILVLFVLTVLAWDITNINVINFIRRFRNFFDILRRMLRPNLSYLSSVSVKMIETVQMSFLGTFIGAIFALPFAFLSAGNIVKNKFVVFITRLILSILRTIPVLVYASILALIFFYGTFAGTVSIAIFTFALLTKMIYEQIETIDLGPFIAIESTGASKVKAFSAAIMPQILPAYLSYTLYCLEINIRFAAILGWVGAGGIGLLLDDRMAWLRYQDVAVILIVLFFVVFAIESLSRYLRRRLV